MPSQEFHAFWHGPALSPYEELSLLSFLDHGHSVTLHVYEEVAVPPGVTLAPAEAVVPRSDAFVLKGYDNQGGHVAFSNLFRFELLASLGGWWIDLDVVCLQSEIPEFESFYALEQEGPSPCEVGSAVLRFQAGDPLPRRCADECRERSTRLVAAGSGRGAFGSLGASLIEEVTRELGRCAGAHPPGTCYPIHWSEIDKLTSPAHAMELTQRTERSFMVHLWNEARVARRVDKRKAPPRGSFLEGLFERHAVHAPKRGLLDSVGETLDNLRRSRR